MSETTQKDRGRRQEKVGVVLSSKMDKTVVVAVEKTITHRLYHRYQKRTSKFYAHDEENKCKPGDKVRIGRKPPAVAAEALDRRRDPRKRPGGLTP